MIYIKRAIENVLEKRGKSSKCILVTGPRQVGKSTLLKHIYGNVKYITFDDELVRVQAKEEPGLFFINNKTPLIIDEVQLLPEIFPYIKMKCDDTDKYGNFYLTGSQQFELVKNISESLAGRISILELQGLSLREINDIDFNKHFIPTEEYINERENKIKKYDDIWEIIHKGSFPELHNSNREWLDFYSSYIKTYLSRDVNQFVKIKDDVAFIKFLTVIAARTGEILNYSNVADEVGVSQVTIKEWVSVLQRSGIVYLLQPYTSSVLNRTIKSPKIYFRDTGLACYLTKWLTPDSLKVSAVAGNMFETFVVSEIIKSYINEGRDYSFNVFYYRGKDKMKIDGVMKESEIDLIIEENGVLHPVEIKMSANPKANMAKTFDVLDKEVNKKRGMGAIVCLYDKKMYLRENLIVLPIEYI